MDVDVHIYVDVQSLRTSNGESYSSVESRRREVGYASKLEFVLSRTVLSTWYLYREVDRIAG